MIRSSLDLSSCVSRNFYQREYALLMDCEYSSISSSMSQDAIADADFR